MIYKNNKKNILITCAGGSGPIYMAKKMKNKFNVFLVDATDQTIAPYLGLPFEKIPFGNDPNYLRRMEFLIKKWNINCIVPGADEELLSIKILCEGYPSLLAVLPSKDFITLCLNKKKLMEVLEKSNISHLLPFTDKKSIKYPAIAKPIFGRGSREVHIIKDSKQLEGYLKLYNKKFEDILIQPYIGGEEYTISAIVNNLNQIISIVPKKIILKRGITRVAVTEKNIIVEKITKAIVEKLHPSGPFNIQLKIWKNRPYIFEINPRLSTTSVLTDKALENEVELYIRYNNIDKIKKTLSFRKGVYLYRYEENYFK
ncbi:MAG: ATP-grasp domain-containing protein [Candidatus Paceibacterota bacterium]|jgi:carbamoyl-phosphate synthase large subunit